MGGSVASAPPLSRVGAGSPPHPIDADGSGGGWVPLTRAEHDIEAHLIQGRLDDRGIESMLVRGRGTPGSWLLAGADPWAPVTVMVRKMHVEDASIVLAEISFASPAVDPEAIRRRRSKRGAITWWVVALALGVTFTALGLAQAANDLDRCHGCSPARGTGSAPAP